MIQSCSYHGDSRKIAERQIENQLISGPRIWKPKGGFLPESGIRFSNLQISKKKNIPKNYPELEI